MSYAIDIHFKSRDPALAARYRQCHSDCLRPRADGEPGGFCPRRCVAWLEKRIDEAGAQMNKATQVAQEFRATYDYRVDRRTKRRSATRAHSPPTLEQRGRGRNLP